MGEPMHVPNTLDEPQTKIRDFAEILDEIVMSRSQIFRNSENTYHQAPKLRNFLGRFTILKLLKRNDVLFPMCLIGNTPTHSPMCVCVCEPATIIPHARPHGHGSCVERALSLQRPDGDAPAT